MSFQFCRLLWWLLVAHALSDVVGQSERMAKYKRRAYWQEQGVRPAHWGYWLLAHGLLNGLGVALVTGKWWLGVCETVAHALIDWGKCEEHYNVHIDQFLHLACKVSWAWLAIS